MAFTSVSLMGPTLTDVDTTAKFPLGTIIRATDPALGEGEFIYLKGVAGTTVGAVAIYDLQAATSTLAVAGSRGPAAVAMAAVVASTYGWYQISGSAIVFETGATAGANVYVTATAGRPSATTVVTDKIDGARFKSADGTPSAGFAYAMLARPCLNANG